MLVAKHGMVIYSKSQAVFFGRWKVEGVGVRDSITYRLTNPSRSGLVCMVYTPQKAHSPNLQHSNNNTVSGTSDTGLLIALMNYLLQKLEGDSFFLFFFLFYYRSSGPIDGISYYRRLHRMPFT